MTKPLQHLAPLLDRLHGAADAGDPALISRIVDITRAEGRPLDDADPRFADLLAEAYIPVSRDVGRLLYILARAHRSRTLVEFGTSFGISTIYLAAAARENGGRVITSEQNPEKARRARQHFDEAGLSDVIELRLGDARETLRDLPGPIDLLFLDGWKSLYLPLFDLLEPKLRPGALVIGDDLDIAPAALAPYLARVRGPGYSSVELTIGDAMEVSVRD
jgi:predicted O-methyltransferase YrrM